MAVRRSFGRHEPLHADHSFREIYRMSIMDQLTERQREVYEFLRDKIRNRGYGPTVREIGDKFQISSPNGVMCHLKALEKKGLISREPNMSRAIQLSAEPIEVRGLPMAGRIAAGVLHEAIEQDERIDFAAIFEQKNQFVLKVSGDSMIDAQIADGDYVVVRKQRNARDGQIVVAITDEGEATLKRFYLEKNRIRLEPANSSMKPIYVKNAKILGIVVGVVRQVE
jgi:repressor LexA